MIKYPKNFSSIRDVSINKSLNDYLLSIKEKEKKKDNYSDTWFIFGGEKPLSRTSIERVKNAAVKMSGVKKIRLHYFRHSHASILIGEGVDIVAVSKRLGHSNVGMTLKVYTHLLDKNDDKLVDFVEKSSHDLLTAIKSWSKLILCSDLEWFKMHKKVYFKVFRLTLNNNKKTPMRWLEFMVPTPWIEHGIHPYHGCVLPLYYVGIVLLYIKFTLFFCFIQFKFT